MNNSYLLKHQRGFTLLEVLIAIGITALIGLGTWQLLSGTIRAQEITQKNSERFERLQKMMVIMSRDIKQVNTRAIRDEFGDFQPAISNQNTLYLLELTRSGWRNPREDSRSDLQRVSYELVDGELLRHYWKVLDRAQDSESVYQVLLNDIDAITVRFMQTDNQWVDSWPPVSTGSNPRVLNHLLPKAIELTIEHNYFGTLIRLYDLPQYLDISSSSGAGGGSGGGSTGGNGSSAGSGSSGTNTSQSGSSQPSDNSEIDSTPSDGDQ